MLTQKDIDIIEEIIDEKLDNRFKEAYGLLPSKNEFFDQMSQIMGELKAIRDSQDIITGRVSNHEDRLTTLESHILPTT